MASIRCASCGKPVREEAAMRTRDGQPFHSTCPEPPATAPEARPAVTPEASLPAALSEPLSEPTTDDPERSAKLDAQRVTYEFRARSQRRWDRGKKEMADAPLFGGERQENLFEEE